MMMMLSGGGALIRRSLLATNVVAKTSSSHQQSSGVSFFASLCYGSGGGVASSSTTTKKSTSSSNIPVPQMANYSAFNNRLSKAAAASTAPILPSVKPLSMLQPKHYVPRAQRTCTSMHNHAIVDNNSSSSRQVRKHRTDITRKLNYTPVHWKQHKDVWRHFRHLLQIFSSSALQRLAFPDLTVNATIAAVLCYYNMIVVQNHPADILWMDGASMAGATTAVGLLAGFRVQASYQRYDEARKFWGEINNAARDLAGNSMMWLVDQTQRKRMLRLIQAFPVAVQWQLNDKGGHYQLDKTDPDYTEQVDAEFYAEMLDIYEGDEADADFCKIVHCFRTTGVNLPLGVASWMRQIIASNNNAIDAIYNQEMDQQVSRLVACLGMCERVLRTPLPPNFTRHTSRLFYLWSNMLPFAMYGSMGLATIPASVMVSWAILGIEDVGVQLEEPFSMLPLRQYSDGMYAGVNDIRDTYLMGSLALEEEEEEDISTTTDGTTPMPERNFVDMVMRSGNSTSSTTIINGGLNGHHQHGGLNGEATTTAARIDVD